MSDRIEELQAVYVRSGAELAEREERRKRMDESYLANLELHNQVLKKQLEGTIPAMLRFEAANSAMHAMLSSPQILSDLTVDEIASDAVTHGDALLKALEAK